MQDPHTCLRQDIHMQLSSPNFGPKKISDSATDTWTKRKKPSLDFIEYKGAVIIRQLRENFIESVAKSGKPSFLAQAKTTLL